MASPELGRAELRGTIPREISDILDAVVHANPGMTRIGLVEDILKSWAERKRYEATIVLRLAKPKGGSAE